MNEERIGKAVVSQKQSPLSKAVTRIGTFPWPASSTQAFNAGHRLNRDEIFLDLIISLF